MKYTEGYITNYQAQEEKAYQWALEVDRLTRIVAPNAPRMGEEIILTAPQFHALQLKMGRMFR